MAIWGMDVAPKPPVIATIDGIRVVVQIAGTNPAPALVAGVCVCGYFGPVGAPQAPVSVERGMLIGRARLMGECRVWAV